MLAFLNASKYWQRKCPGAKQLDVESFSLDFMFLCVTVGRVFIPTECRYMETGTKQNFPFIMIRLYKNCKSAVGARFWLSTRFLKLYLKDKSVFLNWGKRF